MEFETLPPPTQAGLNKSLLSEQPEPHPVVIQVQACFRVSRLPAGAKYDVYVPTAPMAINATTSAPIANLGLNEKRPKKLGLGLDCGDAGVGLVTGSVTSVGVGAGDDTSITGCSCTWSGVGRVSAIGALTAVAACIGASSI